MDAFSGQAPFLLLMLVVFFFFIILPQQRRQKKEKNFFETRVIDYQTGGSLQWDDEA